MSSLYTQAAGQYLARAIDDLQRRRPDRIFALADAYADRDDNGDYSNLFDANNAVNCADDATTRPSRRSAQLQSRWRAKYPLFGAPLAIGLLNCAVWPAKKDPYPVGPATLVAEREDKE